MKKTIAFFMFFVIIMSTLAISISANSIQGSNYTATQDGNTLELTWEKYGSAYEYRITCYNKENINEIYTFNTKDTKITIENLLFNNAYMVSVYAIYVSWEVEVFTGLEFVMTNEQPHIEYNYNGCVKVRKYTGMEYSFEGGEFSYTNEFYNLTNGTYRIIQRDRNGTLSTPIDFRVNVEDDPYIDTKDIIETVEIETQVPPPVITPEITEKTSTNEPLPETSKNTKTNVYGYYVYVVNQNANFDDTYKISATDVSGKLYAEDRSTFNDYVKKMKKAVGSQYGDVLALFEVDFGVMVDGNYEKRNIMPSSVLAFDVTKYDIKKAYMCAVYKDSVTLCTTTLKDNQIKTLVNFDNDFAYIAIIGDKDALKDSSFIPNYSNSSSSPGGKTNPTIEFSISPTIIIITIITLALVVGAIFFTLTFVRKVRRNKSKEWLNDNR